jgi:hypothetical protein
MATFVERVLAAILGSSNFHGEMYEFENAVITTINTQNADHAVNNFMTGTLYGFTFVNGLAGSGNITDYGGTVAGTVALADAAHGLTTGDYIAVTGTTNYNGVYEITTINGDSFYFTAIYIGNEAGTWDMGSYLLVDSGSDAVYKVSMTNTSFSASANNTFKFSIYLNDASTNNIVCSNKYGSTDYTPMPSSGLLTLVAGDRIWLAVQNQTGTANITIRHANVNLSKV